MNKLFITMSAAMLLAACSDSAPLVAEAPTPTPPPAALDYTTFVKAQIADTSDTREPVEINDLEFSFGDLDNPNAYDDLFTTP